MKEFLLAAQLPEATKAVQEIGLAPAVVLIIMLALLAAFTIIMKWMLKKIDEKDTQLLKEMEARREDFAKMERAMSLTAIAVEKGTENMKHAFDSLAQEVRRK